MHYTNKLFWEHCRRIYPTYFKDPSKVVEFGSLNINGSIRDHFSCADYIGLDWRQGPGVDLICLAHKAPFAPESVDTVVSASMLEHDPYWEKSLSKIAEVMRPNGFMGVTWGAALNNPHCVSSAPDGKFHPLRAGLVLNYLEKIGIYVHEFQYEEIFLIRDKEEGRVGACARGAVALIAFKDKSLAVGKREISPLIPKDMI